jgi:hypothetical protein
MDAAQLIEFYGTAKRPSSPQLLTAGRITARLESGDLRDIRFDGVELVRAIGFTVRDRDWGTLVPQIENLVVDEHPSEFRVTHRRTYENNGSVLCVDVSIVASEYDLRFEAKAVAKTEFETSRTGFTLLHPVSVSGAQVAVEDCDGAIIQGRFPLKLEPWQPFKNIRCLSYELSGRKVSCRMEGDVFEMEDQRNWSDASFKTYVRPLALPWPYILEPGAPAVQSVTLDFSGEISAPRPAAAKVKVTVGKALGHRFPETALVLTPAEAKQAIGYLPELRNIGPQHITCHFDPDAGHKGDDLLHFAELQHNYQAIYDLEYAARCSDNLKREFEALSADLKRSEFCPSSALICPSVDRQSTPPGSEWPATPPLEKIYGAVRAALPDIRIGGGMMSYFTELNRKQPPLDLIDFVTHGTNPIVHAADEESVMQTLSTIPFIARTARQIAGDTAYRLGLSCIPMRQNPYGSRTMDNSDGERMCMADRDPRHWARFGAAYAAGYAAMIAPFQIECWTPAAFVGDRGLIDGLGEISPLGRMVSQLAELAGGVVRDCRSSHPERVLALAVDSQLLVINLTAVPVEIEPEGAPTIEIGPYSVQLL